MIPEAVQRAQDDVSDISDEEDESPYHETLGIIRGLGVEAQRTGREGGSQSGTVQSTEPMTAQKEHETRAKLEQTLSGTAMRLRETQPGQIKSEAEALRTSNSAVFGHSAHIGKRAFSPDNDEDFDQDLYLPDWEKAAMHHRRKAWKAEHPGKMVPYHVLHPTYSKGIVVSEEPEARQHEPEAERKRASNAAAVQQSGKGKETGKCFFSPEDDDDDKSGPPAQSQLEAEKLRALKERDQKIKKALQLQEASLERVHNKGSAISEEPVSRQRDEAEKMRALNDQAGQQFSKDGSAMEEELRKRNAGGGWLQEDMTQSRESQNVQRTFSESERTSVETDQMLRHGGIDPKKLKQQISEAEMSGNYSRAEALKRDFMNAWANETKGAKMTRIPEDRRSLESEAEKM